MKNQYPAHFKLDDKKIEDIWRLAHFAFDANTMLNLYRYSDTTRKEFIKVLQGLNGRVWLPEQAAVELFSNRLSEISLQVKAYDATKTTISNLKDELTKSRGHPYISTNTMKNLTEVLDTVESELSINKNAHLNRINNDDILEEIAALFEERIGQEYNSEQLSALIEEGDLRMKAKTPPGYMDYPKYEKPTNSYEKRVNYGDFIVWMQVIDLSIKNEKPIILITDDSKEDWWLKVHGRTVGPRTELREEFLRKTGQHFLLYNSEQFLRYAKDHLQSNVSKETLEEIKESKSIINSRRLSAHEEINSLVDLMNLDKRDKLDKNDKQSELNKETAEIDVIIDKLLFNEEYQAAAGMVERKLDLIRDERFECETVIKLLKEEMDFPGAPDLVHKKLQHFLYKQRHLEKLENEIYNSIRSIRMMAAKKRLMS